MGGVREIPIGMEAGGSLVRLPTLSERNSYPLQKENIMSKELIQKGPHVPTEKRAVARLKRVVELGELEELPNIAGIPSVPRYLVTYMNSQTANDAMRSATVVSVTNQSSLINRVFVTFFKGFPDDSSPACHHRLEGGRVSQTFSCALSRRIIWAVPCYRSLHIFSIHLCE